VCFLRIRLITDSPQTIVLLGEREEMMWCVRVKLDKAVACWIITGDWVPGRWQLPTNRMDQQPKPKRRQPAIDRRGLRLAGALFQQLENRKRRSCSHRAGEVGY